MPRSSASRRLNATDMLFLLGESSTVMNHVGALLTLTPPDGAPMDWMRALEEATLGGRRVQPPWNLKLAHPEFLRHPAQAWVEDAQVDLGFHVRQVRVPPPGDAAQVHALVSRLHGQPVDFTRPPWEVVLLEGLESGRVAIYAKMHHALIDGFTGIKLLRRSLSTDPNLLDAPLFLFNPPPRAARPAARNLWQTARSQLRATPHAVGAIRDWWQTTSSGQSEVQSPIRAPQSILNGRISKERSFSARQFDLAHIKELADRAHGTINDIVLAISAGALRRFLLGMDALPEEALVAMIPVNIRPEDDPGGGNSVGALLTSLATHIPDPAERLEAIMRSMTEGKQRLQGLSQAAIFQYSAMQLLPAGVQHLGGFGGLVRPQFNLVISNVPGPLEPLYFRGARLDASYPISFPFHGQALNISCQSLTNHLNFGLTACRQTFPHLARLGDAMQAAFDELDAVLPAN